MISLALPATVAAQIVGPPDPPDPQPGRQATPTFSKVFSPSTIVVSGVSTLQFDIDNQASDPAGNLAFTDSLPVGVTIASPPNASSTCGGTLNAPGGGGSIVLSGGVVSPFSACSVSVRVTSSTVGTHSNVSGDLTSDAGNSGNASADLTVVDDRPGFTKSFSPSTVPLGGRSTLTLTIDNTAANAQGAFNLTFTDVLPSGMRIASPSNKATTCSGGTLTAPAGQGVVSYVPIFFGDASVAAGSSCTVSVDVVGTGVGVLNNVTGELTSTTQFSGTLRSSGAASASLTTTAAEISLTKSFTDDPVAPGATVNLELTVRNLNRDGPATNVAFTDDLDAALSGLAATGSTNDCGGSLSGTSFLSFAVPSLGPEASCSFSVTLNVPSGAAAGSYTNTTNSITADISGSSVTGDPASDILFVSPIPTLTKSFTDDPVGAGGSATLEFTIENTSSTSTATDIAFQDIFDVILPTASSVPAAGFCGPSSTATFTPLVNPTGFGGTPANLSISGASLAASASCTFSITLDVVAGAPSGIYANTTSEITATVDGVTVTGNPASDDLEIVGGPVLTKEFTDDPAQPGGSATLEFTLIHDEFAPADATAITFTDDLALALTGLAATGLPASDVCGAGSQIAGTSTLTLTGGILAPGETCTFSVALAVPAGAAPGAHTNTTSSVMATVAGAQTESSGAVADLLIAGLTLSKEFINDPAVPGGTVTLRFTLNNINPATDATAITFSDDLDAALENLTVTGLPMSDVCGVGSVLNPGPGNRSLVLSSGALAAGVSCSFDVALQVPAAADPGVYANTTSAVAASMGGSTVVFDAASDSLTVAVDFLSLAKEFVGDPVSPGGTVGLRFTISNLSPSDAITDISFTDDLDAALLGLQVAPGGLPDVTVECGGGATISGVSTLSFAGGSLAGGGECAFTVMLEVPSGSGLGSVATNTTSTITGMIGGQQVSGDPAADDLLIDFIEFSKSFQGSVDPGDTVDLSFTIQNLGSGVVDGLSFSDNLTSALAGLAAAGLPSSDVCGQNSVLSVTVTPASQHVLGFTGGNLLPGGSCTFAVTLQVPSSAAPGSYVNSTSDLVRDVDGQKSPVADPAVDSLVVLIPPLDEDEDAVPDSEDLCPNTVIPEGVPTQGLGTNRHALVNDDTLFYTQQPKGQGGDIVLSGFSTLDTAGCSCEQIIAAEGLGQGHIKSGCSNGAMEDWIEAVGGGN